jgi:hypothetical protein
MTVNRDHPLFHLVRQEPGVRVERREPSFDHLIWTTLAQTVGKPLLDLGDAQAVSYFRALMRMLVPELTFYVNPWSLVTADRPTRAFLIAAKREKLAWQKRLRDIFFGSARTQRFFGLKGPARRAKSPELRQLEFHGVLVLAGEHVFPDRWPDPSRMVERRSLVRQTFGRVTVLEDLPRGRHLCRCECGNERVFRRGHLLAGRVKSCGCQADEEAARTPAAATNDSDEGHATARPVEPPDPFDAAKSPAAYKTADSPWACTVRDQSTDHPCP